jgi:hypothetical protein
MGHKTPDYWRRPSYYGSFQSDRARKTARWAFIAGAAVVLGALLLLWFGDEDGTLAELVETPITDTISDAYFIYTENRAMAQQLAACEHDFGGAYMRRWEEGRHDICPPHAGWVRTHTPLGAASKVQCWELDSGPLVACLSSNLIARPSGGGSATAGLSCGAWSRKESDDEGDLPVADGGEPEAAAAAAAEAEAEASNEGKGGSKAGKAGKAAKASSNAAAAGKKGATANSGGGGSKKQVPAPEAEEDGYGGGKDAGGEGMPDRKAGRRLLAGEYSGGGGGAMLRGKADGGGAEQTGKAPAADKGAKAAAEDDSEAAAPPTPTDGSLAGPAALPLAARPVLQQWLGQKNVKALSAKRVRALCRGRNAITQPVLLVERQDTINLFHAFE